MHVAVYILYELLIRLQELNPAVGNYSSFRVSDNGVMINTSSGQLIVPQHILTKQFTDPTSISQQELIVLLDSFKLGR